MNGMDEPTARQLRDLKPRWPGLKLLAVVLLGVAVILVASRKPWRDPPRVPIWRPEVRSALAEAGPRPSAGCARGATPAGRHWKVLSVDGQERSYQIQVPANSAARPVPVVFFFHGRTPLGRGPRPDRPAFGGLDGAPGAQAIFVAPRGTTFEQEQAIGWEQSCGGVDVKFFDLLLDTLAASHCIDLNAVFASGFSWGADMANALACCRGERLRAVAAASGADMGFNARCPARAIPAFRLTHGDHEPYLRADFAASVEFYRRAHGCSVETDPVAPAPCVQHRGCARPVVSCRYQGMGHAFPPDFVETTWAFFSGL